MLYRLSYASIGKIQNIAEGEKKCNPLGEKFGGTGASAFEKACHGL
jgi:hypothetical protein